MFNAMNTVRPRPYPQRQTGNYNAGAETDKDGHNPNGQGQPNGQNGQQAQQTISENNQSVAVQTRPMSYVPANNAYPVGYRNINQINSGYHTPIHQASAQQYQTIQQNSYQQNVQPQSVQLQNVASKIEKRSNKVNIAQILKDFKNTIKAIATPPEIEENVHRYLQIVEQQVREPQPQVNLIQSNLKIAASLLDKYISDTLNKDSKVVQNWLDALFLQRINYSYNEEEINPSFLVQFPDDNKKQENSVGEKTETASVVQEESQQEVALEQNNAEEPEEDTLSLEDYQAENLEEEFTQAQNSISHRPNITIIPQDTKLKSLFMEAKKHAFSNNPQKAMSIFKEAFNRAGALKDSETQSRICLEIGKIYDDNDFVVQALNSYNKSLQYTTDTNVKSKAHYSMAQIYDDVNQVGPALEHYITSISYAGKSDDLITQSDSLTRVANIFTDKYDENAFEYYEVAKKLVEQTADSNMKGYVLSNTADACVQFKKNDKALKYYAEAVKNYEKSNSTEEIAQNYKSAAELMIEFNSPNKAKSLLKKALVNAVKTTNEDLISEINLLLASISE